MVAKARKLISLIVGGIQCGIGGIAAVFAFLVYISSQVRDAFQIATEEIQLYMFIFLVFALFSITSGLLLIQEKENSEG